MCSDGDVCVAAWVTPGLNITHLDNIPRTGTKFFLFYIFYREKSNELKMYKKNIDGT